MGWSKKGYLIGLLTLVSTAVLAASGSTKNIPGDYITKSNRATLSLPTTTDTLVGRATTDTLTNKTYTIGTASRALQTGAGGNLEVSSTIDTTELGFLNGVTSSLCGINQSCTETNKTLTSPVLTAPGVSDFIAATETTDPATPSAGVRRIYAKSDGLYQIDSAGLVSRVGSGGGGLFDTGQNLLLNDSCQDNTNSWTASGSSVFARTTTAAHVIPPGAAGCSWDPSASSETLTASSVAVTANDGLSAQAGVLSCLVKTAATDLKLEVFDGSNVISPNATADVIPASAAGFVSYSVGFQYPSSGTLSARFRSQSNSAIAYFGQCYWGLDRAFNSLSSKDASFIGSIKYAGVSNCHWNRTSTSFGGFSADTDCNAPTVTGGVSAPGTKIPGLVIGSAGPGVYQIVARGGFRQDTSDTSFRMSDGTTSSDVTPMWSPVANSAFGTVTARFELTSAQSNWTVQIQGRSGSGATNIYTDSLGNNDFSMEVYYFPSATSNGYRVDQTGAVFQGHHGTNCVFARTNTALGVAAADSTCDFNTIQNFNFGTVTSQLSGSDKLPGIVFTPSRTGVYMVTATAVVAAATSAAQTAAGLTVDGGSTYLDTKSYRASQANDSATLSVVGMVNATNLNAITASLHTAAASGAVTIDQESSALTNVISWTITPVSPNLGSPFFPGNVTSNTTSQERVERAILTSAGAVTSQSGSWISFTSKGTGNYVYAIAAGIFSATPTCICSANSGSADRACNVGTDVASSTALNLYLATANNGTATDTAHNVICMGPR